MIYFDGVKLEANGYSELQEFARKMGISRSWIHVEPSVYYDVICPFKARNILNYIRKKKEQEFNKKNKRNGK